MYSVIVTLFARNSESCPASSIAGYFLNKAGAMTPQWSPPLFSTILLGLVMACCKFTLLPLARLLQRREQRILDIVTHEVE
jgi:hypothetical protein